MRREPIKSKTIASAGYDAASRTLEVEFIRGNVYRFLDVPQVVVNGFNAAPSKGRFFGANIRDKFKAVKVTGHALRR